MKPFGCRTRSAAISAGSASCMVRTASRAAAERLERRVLLDSTVVFNEVMYQPTANSATLEWVELHNQMAVNMDVSGWSITSGIDYTFPSGTVIPGGGFVVVASSPSTLQSATGYAGAFGPFSGRLSNEGEELQLRNNSDRVMDTLEYGIVGDWPVGPAGSGRSLVKISEGFGSEAAENWTTSRQINGTPGARNFTTAAPAPAAPAVVINETGPGGPGFFVEFTNTTGSPVSVANHVVRRVAGSTTNEYVIPSGSIPANGHLHLTASQLGFAPVAEDRIFLLNPDRSLLLDSAAVDTVARARPTGGKGDWWYPTTATPGAANNVQLNSSIVINEIMYNDRAVPQQPMKVALDGAWKYNQAGTDLGTGWRAADYNDAAWASGRGVFHAGNVPGVPGPDPQRQQISTLFSTGLDNNRNPIAAGQRDPHYTIVSTSDSRETVGGNPLVINPHPAWADNSSSSRWLGPVNPGSTDVGGGVYVYKTTFDLSGFVPSTAEITLNLYADNFINDVLINGQSTGISAAGFSGPLGPFTISSGFVSGINTLEFVWQNEGTTANPGGFRARMSGSAQPVALNTPLNLGPNTYYFRTTFDFAGSTSAADLLLTHFIDDGAVFYLNGQEVHRFNMPAGAVSYGTLAQSVIPSASVSNAVSLPASALRQGTNVLAVEVHQPNAQSSDIAFGAELFLKSPGGLDSLPEEEWIELYNRSGQTVDLSNWKLSSAIDYTFPSGTTLGAGQYLVVARDAAFVRSVHPSVASRVIGNYSRSLSGKDDRILLTDARGNPADDVHYYDGGRWDGGADGGGASLELRNPHADNASPEAWAASNESGKSQWKTYTYRGVANQAAGDPGDYWNDFVFGLLDSGEILLDDISVIEDPDGSRLQVIPNTSFESGIGSWRIIGNHKGSVITDPTNAGNKVLRLVATGATEHMHNHAETTITRAITNGRTYEISFRAKWVTGSNQLNTRLWFNRVAATTAIDAPQPSGTPAARNSRFVANLGPTFTEFRHQPAVPAAGQAVTVMARAQDPNQVQSMRLFYRVNSSSTWSSLTMTLGSGGVYTAAIPGQAAGAIIQFYVQATDSAGVSSTFPAAGPDSRALYEVNSNDPLRPSLHNLRIIMTAADTDWMHNPINVMSDDWMGGTVIYDENTIHYDVGVRLKSSQRGRLDDNRVGFNIRFGPDNPFRGVHDTISIDRSGGWSGRGGRQDEIVLKHMIQRAGGIPGMYDDLVNIVAPRSAHNGTGLLMMARYGDEFLDSQFTDGGDGTVHKLELIYYPTTADANGYKIAQPDDVVGIDIQPLGAGKEPYRWHYLIENNRAEDDYTGIHNLTETLALSGAALDARSKQTLDVDEFLRLFAMHSLGGDLDSYSRGYQHNMMFYTRPEDGRVIVMPWDWDYAWTNSTNGDLFGGFNVGNLLRLPGNLHAYYGHIKNILDTAYNPTYMSAWTSHYGSLAGQNYGAILSYIQQRHDYARGQLPGHVPFHITTNGGNNFSTDQSSVTISGDGWIDVREIYIQGRAQPLNLTWTDVDSWQAVVPLNSGSNMLNFQAKGFDGGVVGTDSITVSTTATTPRVAENLRVTEIMYNPTVPAGSAFVGTDFEFIELQNISNQPLAVGGSQFTTGVTFTFPAMTLEPGQHVVIVNNTAAFESRYGTTLNVAGEFTGNLANEGEQLVLVGPASEGVLDFTYDDAAPWPTTPDGAGPSLVKIDPLAATTTWNSGAAWRASTLAGGSPGAADAGDTTAPTANVIDVTPDPRTSAVGSMQIVFSEPVTGFDLADLRLTRDGGGNLLTASQTITLAADGRTYTLGNLASLTAPAGTYTLTLVATGSNIRDAAGNLLATNAADTWTVVVAPMILSWSSAATHTNVGEVGLVVPDDNLFVESRSAGVRKILVRFDRPVDPATFTPAAVQLAGNSHMGALNLSGITISTSLLNSNTLGVITFSAALPNYAKYLVRLSGIAGPGGVALSGDADRVFTALIGDVSGDGRVNATDLSRVRGASTGLVNPMITAQVRADVSVDGRVNATDLSRVQARNGNDARGIPVPTGESSLQSVSQPMVASDEDEDQESKRATPTCWGRPKSPLCRGR